MSKVTCDMAMSLDGFTAGPNQRLDAPFGDGARERLTRWMTEEPERHSAVLEGIVAAGRCVWVVTVKAPFTPRSRPYGVAAPRYDTYTAVLDVATGQFLSVTAGTTAPNVLTGANVAAR